MDLFEADPDLMTKAIELGAQWRDGPVLGPSRDELLAVAAR